MKGWWAGLLVGSIAGGILVLASGVGENERGRVYLQGLHDAGFWPEERWEDQWGDFDAVASVAGWEAMLATMLSNYWVIGWLGEKGKTAAPGSLVRGKPVVKRGPTSYAVFVVGAGDAAWVREEGARLRRLGALGLLVSGTEDVELRETLDELGLMMAAAPGEEAAAYLAIESYPALLDPSWAVERWLWKVVDWI